MHPYSVKPLFLKQQKSNGDTTEEDIPNFHMYLYNGLSFSLCTPSLHTNISSRSSGLFALFILHAAQNGKVDLSVNGPSRIFGVWLEEFLLLIKSIYRYSLCIMANIAGLEETRVCFTSQILETFVIWNVILKFEFCNLRPFLWEMLPSAVGLQNTHNSLDAFDYCGTWQNYVET